jgi:hypothetical protein
MSTLKVNTIAGRSSSTVSVATGKTLYAPGQVVQVKQTVFPDTFSTTVGPNFAAVPGLDCAITPKSASSKILVTLSLCYSQFYWQTRVRLLRDSSVVSEATGDALGVRERVWLNTIWYDGGSAGNIYVMYHMNGQYLDSPNTTSEVTYGIDIGGYSTSFAVYINRSHAYQNAADYDATPISTLTLMEIAQ